MKHTLNIFLPQGGGGLVTEGYKQSPSFTAWAAPVTVTGEVSLVPGEAGRCALWPADSPDTARRRRFCDKVEGYGSVCSCRDPSPVTFSPPPVLNNQIADVPVAIIASNRPHYLYR